MSSSAHLRIVPEALGWQDPGASFTAVVQLGTVAAVLLAFRTDLRAVTIAAWSGIWSPRVRDTPEWRLALSISGGTVPIAVLGLVFADAVEGPLRSLGVIAAALTAGSVWLWLAVRRPAGNRSMEELGALEVGLVGLAQAAALVPGVSRSGATIGAALQLGLEPADAARFSFLLSVPAIVLAGLFGLRDVGDGVPVVATSVAVAVAFCSGYLSIRWLLALVARGRLRGFVVYRLTVAAIILAALVIP